MIFQKDMWDDPRIRGMRVEPRWGSRLSTKFPTLGAGGGLGPELTDDTPDLLNPTWTNVGGVYTYDDTATGRVGWSFSSQGGVCQLKFTISGNTANIVIADYDGAVTFVATSNYAVGAHTITFPHTAAGLRITALTASAGVFSMSGVSFRKVL